MTSEHVRVERDGAIGRITFDAPERLNALTAEMLDRVLAAIAEFDGDNDVRVIAVSGSGRAFSSGADLTRRGDGTGSARSPLPVAGLVVRAIAASRTPVVALVPGIAAGVGVSLALSCDYVLAGESSRWVLSFGAIGLMPDGGATALVAANVGRVRALRLALSGEQVQGAQAAEWGLVSECVADDAFAARAGEVLAHLAAGAPLAWAETKAAINAATVDLDAAVAIEEAGQQRLAASDDVAEGIAAFAAKRPPTFRGR